MDRSVGVWMDGQMDRLVDGCVIEQTYSKMLTADPNQWAYGWSPDSSSMFSIRLTCFIMKHWDTLQELLIRSREKDSFL